MILIIGFILKCLGIARDDSQHPAIRRGVMDRLSQSQHLMTREQQQEYNKLSDHLSHLKPNNNKPRGRGIKPLHEIPLTQLQYKLLPHAPSYWETQISAHTAA